MHTVPQVVVLSLDKWEFTVDASHHHTSNPRTTGTQQVFAGVVPAEGLETLKAVGAGLIEQPTSLTGKVRGCLCVPSTSLPLVLTVCTVPPPPLLQQGVTVSRSPAFVVEVYRRAVETIASCDSSTPRDELLTRARDHPHCPKGGFMDVKGLECGTASLWCALSCTRSWPVTPTCHTQPRYDSHYRGVPWCSALLRVESPPHARKPRVAHTDTHSHTNTSTIAHVHRHTHMYCTSPSMLPMPPLVIFRALFCACVGPA